MRVDRELAPARVTNSRACWAALRLALTAQLVGDAVAAVRGKIAMSESLLRTHLTQVRRVLGDGVIETVVGRGYRFLLDVEWRKSASAAAEQMEALATGLVGRQAEIVFSGRPSREFSIASDCSFF